MTEPSPEPLRILVVEDEPLKSAAAKDQLRPDEAAEQAEAGDAWWSLVETADERGQQILEALVDYATDIAPELG